MNAKLEREHKALLRKWATGSATAKQVARCMELDRKAEAYKRERCCTNWPRCACILRGKVSDCEPRINW